MQLVGLLFFYRSMFLSAHNIFFRRKNFR